MTFQYCDRISISKNCYLIIGRHLDLQKQQADVANSIIFKGQSTLYIIDTGVLPEYRQALLDLCHELEPYEKVVLINTHGHGDHVGNNSLINELNASNKQHFISAHDLEMMLDNLSFFEISFQRLTPFLTDDISARDRVAKLLKLFEPIEAATPYLQSLQIRFLSDIKIGNIHWSGWNFNDEVFVLRSEGHSAGHVMVYFPEGKHLHMADETNGYCNLFHDCDHLKALESHTKTISMLDEGTINSMSDGHTFQLYDSTLAKQRLQTLIDSHYCYGRSLQNILLQAPQGLTFQQIETALANQPDIQKLSKGVNPNPIYEKLMLLSKFKDFGIVPTSENYATALFRFKNFSKA